MTTKRQENSNRSMQRTVVERDSLNKLISCFQMVYCCTQAKSLYMLIWEKNYHLPYVVKG